MKSILIVCTGNTCRSAVAERVARHIALQRGLLGKYAFASAGLSAFTGAPMSRNAQVALDEVGIEAADHSATNAGTLDLASYDEIHAMTQAHADALIAHDPKLEQRIKVLHVPDPYGGTLEDYRRTRDALITFYEEFIV